MPIHLSISTFRLILFLFFVAIPIVLVEWLILPKYSIMHGHFSFAKKVIEKATTQKVLILGDSTMRTLHRLEEQALGDSSILNVALPGSHGSENLEMLKFALEKNSKIEIVIYGSFSPRFMEKWTPIQERYGPIILSYGEILRRMKNGVVSLSDGLSLLTRKSIGMVNAGDGILEMFLASRGLNLGPLFDRIGGHRSPPQIKESSAIDLDAKSPIEEMLKITRPKGIRLVLILSPFSEAKRKEEDFKTELRRFEEICRLPLECWNLSESVPSQFFGSDGVHYSPEAEGPFRKIILERIKSKN